MDLDWLIQAYNIGEVQAVEKVPASTTSHAQKICTVHDSYILRQLQHIDHGELESERSSRLAPYGISPKVIDSVQGRPYASNEGENKLYQLQPKIDATSKPPDEIIFEELGKQLERWERVILSSIGIM